MGRQTDDATVLATDEAFGMGSLVTRPCDPEGRVAEQARNVSTGEAQRIRLARAALPGAGTLLLAEPESGLVEDGVELVLRLFGALAGACIVKHRIRISQSNGSDLDRAAREGRDQRVRTGQKLRVTAGHRWPVPRWEA